MQKTRLLATLAAIAVVVTLGSGGIGHGIEGLQQLTSAAAWRSGLDGQLAARGIADGQMIAPVNFDLGSAFGQPAPLWALDTACGNLGDGRNQPLEAGFCARLGDGELQL